MVVIRPPQVVSVLLIACTVLALAPGTLVPDAAAQDRRSRADRAENRQDRREARAERRSARSDRRTTRGARSRSNQRGQRADRGEKRAERSAGRTGTREKRRSGRAQARRDQVRRYRGKPPSKRVGPPGWHRSHKSPHRVRRTVRFDPVPLGTVRHRPPRRHRRLAVHGKRYVYHGGVFYRPRPRGYVVVPAPIGARVRAIPEVSVTIRVGRVTLHYAHGAFYRWAPRYRTYVVVRPPTGIVVPALPPGAARYDRGRNVRYRCGEVVYRPVRRHGSRVFVVVRVG